MTYEVEHGEYLISGDPRKLDTDAIRAFLSRESYWADGISTYDQATERREAVRQS